MRFLIVGLAPGLRGANRTGRPFTGDYAGDLLYATLIRFGFARGEFKARPDDGLQLIDTAITNAVRCVPPENKPVGAEINTCRRFPEADDRAVSQPSGHPDAWRHRPPDDGAGTWRPRRRDAVQAWRPSSGRPHFDFFQLSLLALQHQYRCLTEEMFVSVFKDVAEFLETRRCTKCSTADVLFLTIRQAEYSPPLLQQAAPSHAPSRAAFRVSRLSCSFLPRATASSKLGAAAVVEVDLQRHDGHAFTVDGLARRAISRLLSSSLRRRRGSWLKRLPCRYSGR